MVGAGGPGGVRLPHENPGRAARTKPQITEALRMDILVFIIGSSFNQFENICNGLENTFPLIQSPTEFSPQASSPRRFIPRSPAPARKSATSAQWADARAR